MWNILNTTALQEWKLLEDVSIHQNPPPTVIINHWDQQQPARLKRTYSLQSLSSLPAGRAND